MERSGYEDGTVRGGLPEEGLWPDLLLGGLGYGRRLNCATELMARGLAGGGKGRCVMGEGVEWSYGEVEEKASRVARVLRGDLGLETGNRVLLRGRNVPMLAICWLGILKAGCVVVNTTPQLRARELEYVCGKVKVDVGLCEEGLEGELELSGGLERTVLWGGGGGAGTLEGMMGGVGGGVLCGADTASDDVAVLAFTSGTTGVPKCATNFHRDVLVMCDTFSREVLRPREDDVFFGTPPLAFAYGLGMQLAFGLRAGACSLFLSSPTPEALVEAVKERGATVLGSSPLAYRALARYGDDLGGLRAAVSAGEALPASVWEGFLSATGVEVIDGIGSTEMTHIFIASPVGECKAGSTGRAVKGYEAKVVGEDGEEAAIGEVGRLAVRGPTGCLYYEDERQKEYVRDGWNYPGDAYRKDEDGMFWYEARTDDMIVASGYNVSGPEVEGALLEHESVLECGVVGSPDEERGTVVKAFVLLREGVEGGDGLGKELQDFVKGRISPYKYPRKVEFVESLPRTATGKLQRYMLRKKELGEE